MKLFRGGTSEDASLDEWEDEMGEELERDPFVWEAHPKAAIKIKQPSKALIDKVLSAANEHGYTELAALVQEKFGNK